MIPGSIAGMLLFIVLGAAVFSTFSLIIVRIIPLTYQVNALRALMVQGEQSTLGLGVDFAVEFTILVALIIIAARLYPSTIT